MGDVITAKWANVMDEELPPAEDVAARLLDTAAVLGCLPHDVAPAASSPECGPRALALFNPDSPLLVAADQTPSVAARLSQRTARRHASAASSERLRDVQLRADARTVAGLTSPEAPAPLRALRHGVDPQEVVDTVRRELLVSDTVESPHKGQAAQEVQRVNQDVEARDDGEQGPTQSPVPTKKVVSDDAASEEALLAIQTEHAKAVKDAAREQAELRTALERATREKVEALTALDTVKQERLEAVQALEAARAETVHTREEAVVYSSAVEAARQEVEQAKSRVRDETTFLEQELGRLGSELTGWRNRAQSSEVKLAKNEAECQRLEQANTLLSASASKLEMDLKSAKAQVSTLNGMRVAGHKDLLTKKQQIASLHYDLATERARAHDQERAAEKREADLRAQVEQAHKATDRLASLLDGTGEEEGDQWEQLRRKRDAMEDRQLADEMQYAISYRDKKIVEDALSRRQELSALANKTEQREHQLGLGTMVAAVLSMLFSILSAGKSPTGLLVWIAVSLDIAAILFCSLGTEMALCCRLDSMVPRTQRLLGVALTAVIALLLGIDIIPLVVAASNGDTMERWAAPGMASLRVALVSVLAASGVVSTMQRFTVVSGGGRRDGSSRYRASQVHVDQGDQAGSRNAPTQAGQAALFSGWETGTAGGPWAPRVCVHPPSLDIATLWSRSVSTHIRVYNGGNATLRVALESEVPWLHIPPSSNAPNLIVAPKTWKDMPIRVGPVSGSGTWKTAIRVFTDDPTRTEGPMAVPVQLITSAPKLRLQSDDIRIDTAPTLDAIESDVMRPVWLGSDATASVTGATLLFNDGDDVLQLSKFLSNSQGARVGVARAAEPGRNLPLPVFLHPGSNTAFVLTVALPANEAMSVSATPPDGLQVVICSSDPKNNGQTVVPCRVITMRHKIQAVRTIASCVRRWQAPKTQSGGEPDAEREAEPEPEQELQPEVQSSEGPDQMQREFVMSAVRGDCKALQELLQLDNVDVNAAVKLNNGADADVQETGSSSAATSGMGVDLYIPSSSTALVAATANGHSDCVAFLVEAGAANLNGANPNGDTALIMAARFGRRDAMQLLLFPPFGHGADVEQCNDEGSTALHAACCRGEPGCVQLLLDSGCDYTRIDRQGCTGRAIAVKNGHMEIANVLREWSANNARDASGRTARERAVVRRGDAWEKLSSEEQLLAVRREEASMAAELVEAESAFFEAAAAHRSG